MRGLIFFILVTLISWAGNAQAQTPSGQTPPPNRQLIFSGEQIAGEISKATGCAISPILGISILGAYTYYTTPAAERNALPWHASPRFWGPLLLILLGIIMKDSSKIALPKIIVIPLDGIETLLEKNTSAVLGLLVILSSITGRGIEQIRLAGNSAGFSLLSSAHAAESVTSTASASLGFVELGLLSLLLTVVFTLVWIVSQSFNFLIFLSPSSWLDLLLTALKNGTIVLLTGAYLLHPFLGLFISSGIILICLLLFARAYRFVIFGTLFSADILFRRSRKHLIRSSRIYGFAGPALAGVPSLSYGFLTMQDSRLVFHYRPWLVMPLQSIALPCPCDRCEVGTGTLSPVIITPGSRLNTYQTLFRLRPLYTSHEQHIVELFGCSGIRDVAFGKTFRDGLRWLMEQLGFAEKTKEQAA